MPILDRTTLNASDKADFLLNAVSCQAFGDIARVSAEFDVSRKAVCKFKTVTAPNSIRAIEDILPLIYPGVTRSVGYIQGFLELFKAWHNLRTRRSGKHKGTSAYETLTGNKVEDWLTILGFPPSCITH